MEIFGFIRGIRTFARPGCAERAGVTFVIKSIVPLNKKGR